MRAWARGCPDMNSTCMPWRTAQRTCTTLRGPFCDRTFIACWSRYVSGCVHPVASSSSFHVGKGGKAKLWHHRSVPSAIVERWFGDQGGMHVRASS